MIPHWYDLRFIFDCAYNSKFVSCLFSREHFEIFEQGPALVSMQKGTSDKCSDGIDAPLLLRDHFNSTRTTQPWITLTVKIPKLLERRNPPLCNSNQSVMTLNWTVWPSASLPAIQNKSEMGSWNLLSMAWTQACKPGLHWRDMQVRSKVPYKICSDFWQKLGKLTAKNICPGHCTKLFCVCKCILKCTKFTGNCSSRGMNLYMICRPPITPWITSWRNAHLRVWGIRSALVFWPKMQKRKCG